MATPQQIVDAFVIRGGGCAIVRPSTPASSGQVTGAGTDIVFSALQDTEIVFVIDGSASQQEFIEILLDHGVNVQFVKLSINVSGSDGTVKSGSGTGAGDQISFTPVESDLTWMQNVLALRDTRCRVSVPLGEAAGSVGANTGWASVFGKLSSNINRKTQGETTITYTLQFTGLEYTADAGGDTAINAAGATITPLQGSAITPPAIADATELKKGRLILH